MARRNANYFRYGTNAPGGGIFQQMQDGVQWIFDQLSIGASKGRQEAGSQGQKAADAMNEAGSTASKKAKGEL